MEEQYRQAVDQAKQTATSRRARRLGRLDRRAAGLRGAGARRVAGWLGGRSGVVHPVFADRMIPTRRPLADDGRDDTAASSPLAEEKAVVSVREAVTGRVRVSTRTETFAEVVRQELRGMRAEVVRMPVNRTLEPGEAPPSLGPKAT